jgi:UDP-N-acetyl-D-glucosamine dehydrogenase
MPVSKEYIQTVVVQGLGFVGAAMAVAVANAIDAKGKPFFNVIGIDLPTSYGKERIKKINEGIFPFKTVDNKIITGTKNAVNQGNLTATTDENVLSKADVVLVSINLDLLYKNEKTPSVNFDMFRDAMHTLGKNIKENVLIIVETTVPPGTCEKLVKPIIQEHLKQRGLNPDSVYIAHSYERVMPGTNYLDSIINFWRVYAGTTVKAADYCENFLSKIINTNDYPLTRLKSTTASETSKVLENSYRAVNIAFIEEWGRFAEDVGFDLFEVINAIRIRPTHSNIRQPGFGVGGYCLTKDPLFAKIAAKEIFGLSGHNFLYSSQAIELNRVMPLVTLEKLKNYFNGSIKGKKILLMGISYREDVGDTRFSPAETFYVHACKEGGQVTPHDPLVEYWEETKIHISKDLPNPKPFDAVVFSVSHNDYRKIDFRQWLKSNQNCLIFDANNVLTEIQRNTIKEMGNNILSIGRD